MGGFRRALGISKEKPRRRINESIDSDVDSGPSSNTYIRFILQFRLDVQLNGVTSTI